MSNYIEKINQSTVRIFKLVVFGLMVMIGTALLCKNHVNAAEVGALPSVCFTTQEFVRDYQLGQFQIEKTEKVVILGDDKPVLKSLVTTRTITDGITTEGTWLVDGEVGSGKEFFCLLFIKNLGKIQIL